MARAASRQGWQHWASTLVLSLWLCSCPGALACAPFPLSHPPPQVVQSLLPVGSRAVPWPRQTKSGFGW